MFNGLVGYTFQPWKFIQNMPTFCSFYLLIGSCLKENIITNNSNSRPEISNKIAINIAADFFYPILLNAVTVQRAQVNRNNIRTQMNSDGIKCFSSLMCQHTIITAVNLVSVSMLYLFKNVISAPHTFTKFNLYGCFLNYSLHATCRVDMTSTTRYIKQDLWNSDVVRYSMLKGCS